MAVDGGLRALFKKHLTPLGVDCQAIETGGTGLGVPDMNYCCNGIEGWVEFKKTEANAVGLSPEQVAWILRRIRAGGNVYVAVRKKRSKSVRREACDELWLFHGNSAALLKANGLKAPLVQTLGVWKGGPSRWDWPAVKKQILYTELKKDVAL